MKFISTIILSFFIAICLSVSAVLAQDEVIALSDPVQVTDQFEVYGSEMGSQFEITELGTVNQPGILSSEHNEAYFEGIMVSVCQHRGCNFFLDGGEELVRVRFKDYGFFIPTNTEGRFAVVRGHFIEKEEDGETVVELLSSAIKIYK